MSGQPIENGVVSTIPERCKRCYTCIRECPAKAIRVEGGQAMVIQERCISCGNCVRVCAQGAKKIADAVPNVEALLRDGSKVVACLAPSFPAAFHPIAPLKVVTALRHLGFEEVWEVSLGAELVGRAYAKLVRRHDRSSPYIIASSCPAIVSYVEKHMPRLVSALAPVVSPMTATARAIRQRHSKGVKVVFIGPCLAKKHEAQDPKLHGEVDAVLTFIGLARMFEAAGIDMAGLTDSSFDNPPCHMGRSFPISGGLLKTAGMRDDILDNDIVVTEGKERVLAALEEVDTGYSTMLAFATSMPPMLRSMGEADERHSHARLFDVLFCEGCISGPVMPGGESLFLRKQVVTRFVNEQARRCGLVEVEVALNEFRDLDLSRRFTPVALELGDPSDDEIASVLRAMRKLGPGDNLDCGACGYKTCREKAIAVCQGLAEREMCLPYLVDELEETCDQLRISGDELAKAQRRLVLTEKLASMGQLSAGVAHEINNPLGVVLIYSHMLLRGLAERDPQREDLEVIVREASRCRDIVRGLLDFARQSRVNKSPTDLAALIREVDAIMRPRLVDRPVELVVDVDPALPVMMLDTLQIKQVVVNLVQNAADAIEGEGSIRVSARLLPRGDSVEIVVADTGAGIPEENLSKLFTPFFTTKEQGKGTGLGLAITYGVVKMHCGDIIADSTVGKGTTFTVTLPLEQEVLQSGPPA
jgi:signal transduction histidine kinase/iron only hydrogenase large subunit-like protein